ncbi:hypothetical protein ACLKOZ_22240 [Arthrobacter sp. R4]|uniref:hypothetical protein n=1 Tax=Arthrobacter sp. R4 TaxID=644417 RepID=UPI003ED86633
MIFEKVTEELTAQDRNLRIQHDWISAKGSYVQVRHEDRPRQQGVVEDVTDDGAILWIAAHGPYTRRMILRSEGYEVWIAPL